MINPTPKAPNLGAAPGGAASRVTQAYDEGYHDGLDQARRDAARRRVTEAVASALALGLFDLGLRRGWW